MFGNATFFSYIIDDHKIRSSISVMLKAPVYRLVPAWNTAFKVQEDCCYERVVYQGDIGVSGTMDHGNDLIAILLCGICDPNLEIEDITESQYKAILQNVNLRRTS